MSNSFGNLFRISTFGESHGTGIGVMIDGCPAGLKLDPEFIQSELDRRKPGQSRITTQRKEPDTFELLSGHVGYVTTGAPMAFFVRNQNVRSGTTITWPSPSAPPMQTIPISPNTACETTAVGAVLLPGRPWPASLEAQWPNSFSGPSAT
jgi:chorismate synthase